MDLKQIKELIQLLEKSKLHKLTIKEKGMEISLEKGVEVLPVETAHPVKKESVIAKEPLESPAKQSAHPDEEFDPKDCIKSPMVGTFYRASKPTEAPFVSVGDMVEPGQVLCIIEAMKVMNEIKSGKRGKIVKILVENGHPVEFGQPLFVVE